MQRRLATAGLFATLLAVVLTASAGAAGPRGFFTSHPSILMPSTPGVTVQPIITVGDLFSRGFAFESIPDGISLRTRPGGRVDVFVNHETSTVPFPATLTDFTNSMVSRLSLNQATGGVMFGTYVVPSEANFQRFCSNFLAGAAHGFERPLLFTNEEATDFVNRRGVAWPAGPNAEQAGVVVAIDVTTGDYRPIYGMGRHNHENSVAIPGYGHPVLLSGDDTFSAPASQLYMYSAGSAAAVWDDRGSLWAFKSDVAEVNDYSDLSRSGTASVSGRFIPVPREVALGDQNALESWSNANDVFQFIRLEDIAYDRTTPNVVYMADTGEPRALPGAGTARMTRGPASTRGPFPNGRIFRLELDPADPTVVRSLSILVEGDELGAASAKVPGLIHNPDNLETTANSLLIQEDPGSQNNFAAGEAGATTARTLRLDLATRALSEVARVDQAGDPAARLGVWESSGIVDASAAFGPGAFLTNVQAHSLFVNTQPVSSTLTAKREGGQLVLIRIPGA